MGTKNKIVNEGCKKYHNYVAQLKRKNYKQKVCNSTYFHAKYEIVELMARYK